MSVSSERAGDKDELESQARQLLSDWWIFFLSLQFRSPVRVSFLDSRHILHRLVLGTSMGAMDTRVRGESYPDFNGCTDALASLPVEIAGRNRMQRAYTLGAGGTMIVSAFLIQ